MADLAQVLELATDMRDIYERILVGSKIKGTSGTCLHASILLASMLSKFASANVKVCGGGPPMDGGLTDPDGALRGHYWVEGVTVEGVAFVVDITADQFGYEKVVVLALEEGRKRYSPGDATKIAEHVRDESRACGVPDMSGV